ncbi:MAG: DUF4135 domain-containing protein [Atopobiaceae bacterium]|nr:DUF4135 domain-containing protein [Atopobiaceae bacterium]
MIANFISSMREFLEHLTARREDVSRDLLDGHPITRVTGLSASGADPHRHGRTVLHVSTDAGDFLYKPHDCQLDVLYQELVDAWFSDCAVAARIVCGDGYAFVQHLRPSELADKDELRTYWRHLGMLTALFHGLGSKDMTSDNIMCCGSKPAALDLETLLVGQVELVIEPDMGGQEDYLAPRDGYPSSVLCTGVLPIPVEGRIASPLVIDNASGTCLPRMRGTAHTVSGHERYFRQGFDEGYLRLLEHREDILSLVASHGGAVCRQILLNTGAYSQARSRLFSPGALCDSAQREDVLEKLNSFYRCYDGKIRQGVAGPDRSALLEGDIPYYCSRVNGRELLASDEDAPLGELLERSALEVVQARFAQLSEDELRYELGIIDKSLGIDQLGAKDGGSSEIKVFSFVGSCAGAASHTKELSDRLAAAFAEEAARHGETVSYECVTGDQLRISFCRSCASCFKGKDCPLDSSDDMGDLKRRLLGADVILFGSPVYLAEMSGVTKCVLDRISFWSHQLELAGKVGMTFVTASNNHGPEAERHLRELLGFFGISLPEGVCLQSSKPPRLGRPEEAEPVIREAAERLWSAWEDPTQCLTETQELYWKSLDAYVTGQKSARCTLGLELKPDVRILDKRRIDACSSLADYVLQRRADRHGGNTTL